MPVTLVSRPYRYCIYDYLILCIAGDDHLALLSVLLEECLDMEKMRTWLQRRAVRPGRRDTRTRHGGTS
jgi:hypothetical protein